MAFSVAFPTILFLLLWAVHGDYSGEKGASEIGRLTDLNKRYSRDILQLRTPPGVEKAFSHGRKLAQRRNREIQQCTWNAEEEECVISEAAEIEIFSGSNNADAEYFADRLLCDNLDDQESCYDAGCLWSDGRCSFGVTSREIANCFRNATVYLHRSQRDEICGVLRDEPDCEENSQCNWDDDLRACDLDFWNTLTGVPSNSDGTPEGFSEVYAMMRRDSVLAFNEEFPTHRRIENNLEEVLEWRPPPFDCPEEFDPLVCEFVEPFMRVMPISIYCDTMYGRDWEACDEDELCEVFDGENTRQCTISEEQLELAFAEATQIYIDAIHDPFLRDVYELDVNCSRIDRIAACESASCVWLDDEGCTVSNVQLRNAYLEDIDDDSHPVCHIFVVADRYGCEDIMESDECSGDEHCEWDEFEEACYPSEQAIINYILENDPDLEEEFDEVADACATQGNRRDCVNFT